MPTQRRTWKINTEPTVDEDAAVCDALDLDPSHDWSMPGASRKHELWHDSGGRKETLE